MMTAFPWSSFTLMPMNSVVLPMCTIEPTSERLQAMSTPPCGSLPLSRRKTSKSLGINSDEFISLVNHVSVPIIMSGCDESIAICKSAGLFVMLWKFISNNLNLSLGLWWFILLGDDAAVGSPS